MDVVVALAVLVSAGVLAVSLVATARDGGRSGLVAAVVELRLLRPAAARVVVPAVLALEVALVVGLLLPVRAAFALAAAACLFAGYALALALAVRRGADAGCHCFGASGERVARRHVVRTAVLAVLAAAGAAVDAVAGARAWPAPLAPGEWALAAVTALVVVGVVVRLDDLAWLFARRGVA
jgi:hypothetical protein